MTTIVYRNGVLASDTRMTSGGWVDAGRAVKVRRLGDGTLIGLTGNYAMASVAADQVAAGNTEPKTGDGARVIQIKPDGTITVFEDDAKHELSGTDFYAWGSGSIPALGALYAGANAEEAVRIAMKVDPNTGGDVVSVRHEA